MFTRESKTLAAAAVAVVALFIGAFLAVPQWSIYSARCDAHATLIRGAAEAEATLRRGESEAAAGLFWVRAAAEANEIMEHGQGRLYEFRSLELRARKGDR